MNQINSTLYKQASKGAIQQWKVFVEGNVITVEYGQVGGSLQTKQTKCAGKNTGKANATTDNEQAVSEAEAKWVKQTKKGYVTDPSGEHQVLLPMKVESYFKNNMKDKLVFPCTSSRKLNGVNGECRKAPSGSVVYLSRGGEQYPAPFVQAEEELLKVMDMLGVNSLNYEIYKHNTHLQDITGAVKAPHHHPNLWETLEYHVFDLPTFPGDWKTRLAHLRSANTEGFEYVHIVTCKEAASHKDIIQFQDIYISEGYEGSIVRNYNGLYKYNTRSMDILKVKYVQSEEFLVTGWDIDKNNHPIYTCSSKGGDFKVKRKGTNEERTADAVNAGNNVGKWLTVEFETWSKDNKPLKGVGTVFRNCDTQGNPLE